MQQNSEVPKIFFFLEVVPDFETKTKHMTRLTFEAKQVPTQESILLYFRPSISQNWTLLSKLRSHMKRVYEAESITMYTAHYESPFSREPCFLSSYHLSFLLQMICAVARPLEEEEGVPPSFAQNKLCGITVHYEIGGVARKLDFSQTV